MDIRFVDHEAFHRAAAGMIGTAVIAGVALHPVTALAPVIGGAAGICIGAALAYGKSETTWPRGMKGLIALLAGAFFALLGAWCALRIDAANQTAAWNAAVRSAVSAGAMGLVGVVAMLPRHLSVGLDPVAAAMKRLPLGLDGEIRQLCDRAFGIWNATKDRLADKDPGKALLRDGVLKMFEVATRSAQVKVTGTGEADLASRMADLDARIAASTDDEARSQYQQARAALDDQRRYREQIGKSRERMVARMHNHLAALEKFQLAATGLEAARVASAGAAAVGQLAELSQDVAASGEALAELELDVKAAPIAQATPVAQSDVKADVSSSTTSN